MICPIILRCAEFAYIKWGLHANPFSWRDCVSCRILYNLDLAIDCTSCWLRPYPKNCFGNKLLLLSPAEVSKVSKGDKYSKHNFLWNENKASSCVPQIYRNPCLSHLPGREGFTQNYWSFSHLSSLLHWKKKKKFLQKSDTPVVPVSDIQIRNKEMNCSNCCKSYKYS